MIWMFSYLEEGREGTLNSFLFPYGWPAVPTLFIQWLIHFLLIWNATYSSYQISTYAWVCFRYCFIDLSIPEYDFNFRNFKIYIAILEGKSILPFLFLFKVFRLFFYAYYSTRKQSIFIIWYNMFKELCLSEASE